MKVLITGASGLLGRAVHQQCIDKGYDTQALAFSRADPAKKLVKLNLTDAAAVESCLREFEPDVIVHTAAERRPDVVEKDPAASHAINVDAPTSIATIAAQLDKVPLLINISTDYVFDGSKPPYKVDDAPNPLNAYGVSKLQGERAVEEHAKPGHFTNLRVPVLYGRTITNDESAVNILLDVIQPPLGSTATKKCDAYAVRYPTNVADVAKAILKLAQVYTDTSNPVPPTTHFSAKEAMTKYDMCMVLSRIANSVGFETRTDLLDPEYEVDPMAATARPRHCKLDTSVLEAYGVPVEFTSFEDWWRPYLAELHQIKLKEEERLAAEAEAKRQKEEEERRQREAEEEAERQRKLEEEKRIAAEQAEAKAKAEAEAEAEAKRQAEEEAARKKQADEAAASAAASADTAPSRSEVPPSSEAGEAPNGTDHEPGSPHPSFNSLQARPTPPATSGLPSPTSTHPPSSIKSGHRPDTPPPPPPTSKDALSPSAQSDVVIATTDATPTGSIVEESPLNLAAARERQRLGSTLPQRSLSASSAARLTSLTDESTMFGGAARKSSLGGPAYLDTAGGALSRHAGSDSDDDGYGQPSPRNNQVAFPDRGQPGSTTPAGRSHAEMYPALTAGVTGSVASLGSSAPSRVSAEGDRGTAHADQVAVAAAPTAQPRLYHRPSFDQLQDARDREAYERLHRRNWTFTIKVGDPQRIGDPMTGHTVYTVRVQTDCPAFRSQHLSSLRRYRDFRWLHAALVQNNPGIIVPPVPEKVSIGRFAAELVEARRIGLETCINKIANHPLLQQDDDFRLFLESENFAADVKQRDLIKGPIVTPEQKTYKSWGSALLGSVVPSTSSLSSGALSAYSFEETDEWFNEQKMYLDSLENALKGMVKSVSTLSSQRKHMVQATHDLAQVLTTLSGSSLSRSLSTCFAGLAEVKRRAMELEDVQAEADVRQLGMTMYEYERVVGSVRKAFKVRTEVWAKSARHADELRRTRARFDKYKAANPSSAGPQFQSLLAEVTEAETKSLDAQRLFDTVSHRCKDEMERLDLERVLDFKRAVGEWLTDMIARQEEVVEEWVRYTELLGRQTGVQILPTPQGAGEEGESPQQQQPPQLQQAALSRSQSHASEVAQVPAVQAAGQGEAAQPHKVQDASKPEDGEASVTKPDGASADAATTADTTPTSVSSSVAVTSETPAQPLADESAATHGGSVGNDAAVSAPAAVLKAEGALAAASGETPAEGAGELDAKPGEAEVEHSSG
ncbi:related to Vacuolar protein sorting-associated protein VPS5 [Sporisorium reilianum f. sp. reilianum]|uniref:Related to Vacuolar protein sorting-associated protein VPS5 n=1 Tax=Sporisorium reilianum f. sp. reilianum TaxID=72559 RepID=A0A2N8ULN7_9BASI|nr:related to Vacuolar protein sorting-associated protein VPS5 [Sporisorium reilianum f. sp. reilianum]